MYIDIQENFADDLEHESEYIVYNEQFGDSISLENGKFTDAGYRFRYNEYNIQNAWWNIFSFLNTNEFVTYFDVK